MFHERLRPALAPLSMTFAPGGADASFLSWLHDNELHTPRDLKFAFTSAQKASDACPASPATAAHVWASISYNDVDVTSSWSLWMKAHRKTPVPWSNGPRDKKTPSRIWKGLANRKHHTNKSPAVDGMRRHQAAKEVLHLALSWKGRGRLGREWCALQPQRRDAWTSMQIARIATTDVATIRSALRTWKHWCAWCQTQGEDPLDSPEAAPAMFLHSPVGKGLHVPKTAPTTRFNHLRWFATVAGAPVQLAASDRPASRSAHMGLPPEQRIASDPELHIRLDTLFSRLSEADPTRIVVAGIQILWMSVLRFQHMQRSIPVRLTKYFLYAVCWKGKGKPGYRWACPRYGPTGADIGKYLWDKWSELSGGADATPFGLLYSNKIPLSLSQFHTATRAILSTSIGMQDVSDFSSYSLRRSMPTLAEMSGSHPDDADALGDWTSAKSSKMRVRYADSREDRAAVTKLVHMLLVRQMAQNHSALSWEACRLLLCTLDVPTIVSQANRMMATDTVEQETPRHRLGEFASRKRKFDVAALPPRQVQPCTIMPGSASSASQSAVAPHEQHLPQLPLEEGSGRRWVMIKHRGAPHVHLLPAQGELPLCRRRRGCVGKPLKRVQ